MPKISKLTDLFAGIGGFSLAGIQAGVTPVFASDSDPRCQQTYTTNFPDVPFLLADIHTQKDQLIAELKKLNFELLTAGFPCQPFSRAGRQGGFQDSESGQLFFDLLQVIQIAQPPFFLLENVAHLQRHDNGHTFATILENLTASGYAVRFAVLNARDISGLPQNRERLYIVGFRDAALADRFQFPPATDNFQSFSSLLDDTVPDKYYLRDSRVRRQILSQNPTPNHIYTWRRYYLRQSRADICPTLMAGMGHGGYNVPLIVDARGLRQLTPTECLRLQGYPSSFYFPAELPDLPRYAQIGNSISVPTVSAIIRELMQI